MKSMMMFRSLWAAALALFLTLSWASSVLAQDDSLGLSMRRDFGYSSGGGDIQGLFTLTAEAPQDVVRVEFLLDGERLGEDVEPPFKLQFDTDKHSLGLHTLSAVGYTADGGSQSRTLRSREIKARFVSAEEGWQAGMSILVPMLVIILVIIGGGFALTMFTARRKGAVPLGQARNYGVFGGTICPRCGRPFAFHLMKVNLLAGALDFCPHCGKWSLLRPLPLQVLRDAEAAELEWGQNKTPLPEMSEEEKLRKELDDSRYRNT